MDRDLINKQYKNYSRVSRYSSFPYYYNTVDNKYIYGITSQLVNDTEFTIHIAKIGDSWDSLALQYYNDPTYYWVLCDFNQVQDPYIPLKDGQRVKIPTFSSIEYK